MSTSDLAMVIHQDKYFFFFFLLANQDKYGNTALHYACEEERNEVARLLISHGANREVNIFLYDLVVNNLYHLDNNLYD